jgi:predicted Zn-dependent protease
MAAARKLLADDEPERAEALMRELLARAPQDHHAMELLVRALMDQDRGKEALPFARKMVQRRSKRVPYRLLLGDVLLMVGDEAGARVEWQAALQLDPGDREIKRRLGL